MTTSPDPAAAPIFGAAASPFTPDPVLGTRSGVVAAAGEWSRLTSSFDLDDLAIDLLDVSLGDGQSKGVPPGRRAVTLALAGRFDEALAVMDVPADEPLPDTQGDLMGTDLARATCLAARGDQTALAWLLEVAPLVSTGPAAGFVAHCLLLVGDTLGDAALSSAALGQLRRVAPTGRRLVPRLAADLLASRPRERRKFAAPTRFVRSKTVTENGEVVVKTGVDILTATFDLLHQATKSFITDPQPVLDTAALLVERGDRDSAALLLRAVNRTNPQVQRIEAALEVLTPRREVLQRRFRRIGLLLLGFVLNLVALAVGIPFLAGLWALALLASEILTREPGLARVDTGIYRTFIEQNMRPFFRFTRPVSDEPAVTTVNPAARLVIPVLAVVATAGLGLLLFPTALDQVRDYQRSVGERDGLAVVVCFLQCVVIPPILLMWLWSLRPRRRLGYKVLPMPANLAHERCWCWDSGSIEGRGATATINSHLVLVSPPVALVEVLARHASYAPRLATCPQNGAAWLVLTLGPEGGLLLLRSPLGSFPDPDPADSDVPVGQYL